jgi:hypothetical protein
MYFHGFIGGIEMVFFGILSVLLCMFL